MIITLWFGVFAYLSVVERCFSSSHVDLTVQDRLREMEEFMRNRLEEYKTELKSIFGEHPAFDERRSRRTPNETWSYPGSESEGLAVPESTKIEARPSLYGDMRGVRFLIDVEYRNESYLFLGTNIGNLTLYSDDLSTVIASARMNGRPYSAQHFVYEDKLWFVVLCSVNNQHFAILYKVQRKGLEDSQNITCDGRSDLQLVTLKTAHGYDHYLVISTYNKRIGNAWSFSATTTLYKWKDLLFDKIAHVDTDGATSCSAWVMDGRLHVTVAQETDDDGLNVASPVYTYNVHQSRLILIEYVQTRKPKKVKYMYAGDNNYVVFLSENEVSVYSWTGRGFTEWKKLEMVDAVDIDLIHLPNGKVVIGVAKENSVSFFTEFAHSIVTAGEIETRGKIKRVSFFKPSSARLLITDEDDTSRIYDLTFHIIKYSGGEMNNVDPLMSCLLDLRSKLIARAKNIDYMLWNISRIWRYDLEQKVDAELIVKENLNILNDAALGKVYIYPTGDIPTLDYEDEILKVSYAVGDLKENFGKIIKKTGDQLITGRFELNTIEANVVTITTLSRDVFINKISVERLDKYALKTSGDQLITGNINLTNLDVNTLTLDGLINGLRTDDLFLLNNDQVVSGNITFSDVHVNGNIELHGRMNGIAISDFVTATHSHQIYGVKTFQTLDTKDIIVDGFINGQSLTAIENKAVFLRTRSRLSGKITLIAPVTIQHLVVNGLVNDRINIQKLIENGVSVNTEQLVTGKKTFLSTVEFTKDLHVEGKWNDISLNALVTTSTSQTLSGNVVFKKPLYFSSNLKTESINSIKLKEEAVFSFGHQIISSKKQFSSVILQHNITLDNLSTVNGIKLSHFAKLVEDILRGIPWYNNIAVAGSVVVDGKNITDIFVSNIWRKSIRQIIPVPVSFLRRVRIDGNLFVSNINGISIENWVPLFGDTVISGSLTFLDDVYVTSNVAFLDGITLNNFDLSEIRKDIYTTKQNIIISGKKTFKSLTVLNDVECKWINGFKLPEGVMLQSSQTIIDHMNFNEVVVRDDLIGLNLVTTKLKGKNLSRFLKDLVMKDVDSDIISSKTFKELKVLGNIIAYGSIDGVFMKDFLTNVVTLNTGQLVLAKNFTGLLVFEGLLNMEVLNGFYIKNFTKNIVFDTTNVIEGKTTITRNVTILGRAEAELINGINIEELKELALSKSKTNIFRNRVTFHGILKIGTLTVEETIDGVNLSHLITTKSSHEFDEVTFTTTVFTSHVDFQGLINGCDLKWLQENAILRLTSSQNLTAIKQITSLEANHVIVKGTTNDFDIIRLFNRTNTGWKNVNHGIYNFKHISVNCLYVKNTVNEVNLTFLLNDAVQKHREQRILGEKSFVNEDGVIFEKDLTIHGNVCLRGSINKIPWSDLVSTAVKKHENQTIVGTKTFISFSAKRIVLLGSLNRVRIPQDVIVVNRNESFGGTVYIDTAEVKGDIHVHGLVDEISLHDFINRRVTLSTKQEIGNLSFLVDVYVLNDLRIAGRVNNLDLLDIFTSTKTILETTFTKNLTILGTLNVDFLNTYNFTSLASTIVTTIENVTVQNVGIQGQATFHENIIFSDINVSQFMEIVRRMDFLLLYRVTIAKEWDILHTVYNKQVSYHVQTKSGKSCGFAYFVVVTELLPPLVVVRFLPLYNYTRQSVKDPVAIIAWVLEEKCYHYPCCRSYKSYSFMPGARSINTSEPHNGRYYPLSLPENKSVRKGFVVRTKSKGCYTDILTLKTNRIVDIYQIETSIVEKFIVPSSPVVECSKLFTFEGYIYLVLASSHEKYPDTEGSIRIYKYNNTWSEYQKLNTKSALSIDLVSIRHDVYLAVANNLPAINCTDQALVYKFSSANSKFIPVVPVGTSYTSSVLFVQRSGKQYLVVGHKAPYGKASYYKDPLLVYLYYEGKRKFGIVQHLNIHGVVSLQAFSLIGEDYILAADSIHQCIHVLQWRGFNRLEKIQFIPAFGVQSIALYWLNEKLYVAVASNSGHSKILEAVIRGTLHN